MVNYRYILINGKNTYSSLYKCKMPLVTSIIWLPETKVIGSKRKSTTLLLVFSSFLDTFWSFEGPDLEPAFLDFFSESVLSREADSVFSGFEYVLMVMSFIWRRPRLDGNFPREVIALPSSEKRNLERYFITFKGWEWKFLPRIFDSEWSSQISILITHRDTITDIT